MRAFRSTLATLGLVFLISFLMPCAGHTAPAPTNRAGFEKLLTEQANPDSRATDLRAATLALIDREGPAEWAHPAYWGGFAVFGEMPSSQ